jgi:hypothetical protein
MVRPKERTRTLVISFQVSSEHAPALRSAIEEISNIVGARLEGNHAFAKEGALTDAAVALGSLRAAVCNNIPTADPHYQ